MLLVPSETIAEAKALLDADDARTASILVKEPYRNPDNLDAAVVAARGMKLLQEEEERLARGAADAETRAAEAARSLTARDQLSPWPTERRRRWMETSEQARAALAALQRARSESDGHRHQIFEAAVTAVRRRERVRQRWLASLEIQEALADRQRSEAQRRAILDGDVRVAIELLRTAAASGRSTQEDRRAVTSSEPSEGLASDAPIP